MSTNYEEKINQMYDSQLTSQKEQLKTDYETTLSDMDAQQAAAQRELDRKLRATRVDSQRAAVGNAEYYAAAGLSSGARAQARLSQENQLLASLTALRAAQQQSDDETERQRTLLAKEYSSAIQKAQADNDLARAQALYEEAKDADAKLLAKEEAAANLMAQTGDYTRLGALYGLTPEEISKLSGKSSGGTGGGGGGYNNGSVNRQDIKRMQLELGVTTDGKWGAKSKAAAGGLSADEAWQKYCEGTLGTSTAPSTTAPSTTAPSTTAPSGNTSGFTGSTYKEAEAYLKTNGKPTGGLYTQMEWQRHKNNDKSGEADENWGRDYKEYLAVVISNAMGN